MGSHSFFNILHKIWELLLKEKGNEAGLRKIEKMLVPFNLGDMPEIPAATTVNRAYSILNSF